MRGGQTLATAPCTNIAIKAGNAQISLTWTDPDDGDAIWKETIVRYKAGSAPASINDGTIAVKETTRNQYASTPLVIDSLINGTTYYISIFPKSTKGGVNTDITQIVSATPKATSVWTVKIDQNNSNPFTCCTYADAAVGMEKGSSEWDSIFGYKPCVMKDGVVVGYLNPNDFTKYKDGSAAPITDSNYDVMIEFPRMGLNISTDNPTDKIITVSLTDKVDDETFQYRAHKRGDVPKDYFYLGAYLGSLNQYSDISTGKLTSYSGVAPLTNNGLSEFITYAQRRGKGYEIMGFYQWTYIQALYVLKYGNLNSQTALGQGYVNGSSKQISGKTNAEGMNYGKPYLSVDRVKLFGLEDFWGNINQWVCGLYADNNGNLLTTTDNFGTGTSASQWEYSIDSRNTAGGGYIDRVQGNNDGGFINSTITGSATTYFSDYGAFRKNRFLYVGGNWESSNFAGIFCGYISDSASDFYTSLGSRLMYL